MKNLCQILLVCILSLTSVAQAGTPPYCWSLDTGLLGVSPTTLRPGQSGINYSNNAEQIIIIPTGL